jgi:hypothetical protein
MCFVFICLHSYMARVYMQISTDILYSFVSPFMIQNYVMCYGVVNPLAETRAIPKLCPAELLRYMGNSRDCAVFLKENFY